MDKVTRFEKRGEKNAKNYVWKYRKGKSEIRT